MDPVRERNNTLSTLRAAAAPLEQSLDERLIPPEGLSIGFALRGARDSGGVAALQGGISVGTDGRVTAGTPAFGTDDPVVRIILTLVKFDPAVRSAAVLQFSERASGILKNDLFLECVSLDSAAKNPGISTLDWGIASCCKEGVPDVIFRKTACAGDSRIIISGEDPADVANNIIICSKRMLNSAL